MQSSCLYTCARVWGVSAPLIQRPEEYWSIRLRLYLGGYFHLTPVIWDNFLMNSIDVPAIKISHFVAFGLMWTLTPLTSILSPPTAGGEEEGCWTICDYDPFILG